MESSDEQKASERRIKQLYKIGAWVSGLIIIAVFVYGLVRTASGGTVPFGANLADRDFPFPFFAKPVSYLALSSVAFIYCGLRLYQSRLAKWSPFKKAALRLFLFVLAFGSAYEVLFNFMYWGSLYVIEAIENGVVNPDLISSLFPWSWSLLSATKMYSALFMMSAYTIYFMRRMEEGKNPS